MKDIKEVKTIVLGWNYSTSLGVIRSLGMAGYNVDLYFIAIHKGQSRITASSKYLRLVTEHIGRDDENIINELEHLYANETVPCILLPSDDYTSSLIDRYYNRLTKHFLMPYVGEGEQGAITKLMDKSVQTDIASSFGIKTIKYKKVYLPESAEIIIPQGITYPCFVKPLVSLDGRKVEMGKCENEGELKNQLEKMRARWSNRTLIIQDFIDIDEEFSISGLCLNQTVILPALLKRLYVGKHERGVTIVGQLVPLEDYISFTNQLIELLKSIHYTGLFCMDLVRSRDNIYFSEINFRSAGSLYGFVKAGANLPSILVKHLLGNHWDAEEAKVTYGKTFFYDKVGWEDLMYGFCSYKEFKHYLKSSDYTFMRDVDDPKPGNILYKQMCKKYMKMRLKSLLRRILFMC